MYYVYELRDPRCGSTFYVGKGKGNRINAHEIEAFAGRQSRKCDRIRQIAAAGFNVEKAKVKHFEDEQAAFDYEAALIESYSLSSLTNIVAGGGTARGVPTLAKDRQEALAISELLNRTNGIKAVEFQIMGKWTVFEFAESRVGWIERASKIARRRGVEWLNEVSLRYGIVFNG